MQGVFRSVARFQPQRVLTLSAPSTTHSAFATGRSSFASIPAFEHGNNNNRSINPVFSRPFFNATSWRRDEADVERAARPWRQTRGRSRSPSQVRAQSAHLVIFAYDDMPVDEKFIDYLKSVCEENGQTPKDARIGTYCVISGRKVY